MFSLHVCTYSRIRLTIDHQPTTTYSTGKEVRTVYARTCACWWSLRQKHGADWLYAFSWSICENDRWSHLHTAVCNAVHMQGRWWRTQDDDLIYTVHCVICSLFPCRTGSSRFWTTPGARQGRGLWYDIPDANLTGDLVGINVMEMRTAWLGYNIYRGCW
jgi:hypothetical protein